MSMEALSLDGQTNFPREGPMGEKLRWNIRQKRFMLTILMCFGVKVSFLLQFKML